LQDDKLVLPKSENKYPDADTEIKVLHWAGGNLPNKLNYRLFFNEDVIERLDYLTRNEKK
jgi:hypothetical protein